MLKLLIPVLGLVLAGVWMPGAAHAIPADVMNAYRAYMAAIEADDLDAAAQHAEEAYQAGVAADIDEDTLAALAENRAQLLYDMGRYEAAGPAWDAVYAVAPDLNVLALASSAYLLAEDRQAAAERARSLLAAGRGLPDDLTYLARYIVAVEAGPDGFTASTGREAFQRGRAPQLVQDFMREGERMLQRRSHALEFRYAAFAAGAARGIGLHPSVADHFRQWAIQVDLAEREAQLARAHLGESLFAALLIRQGVFPVRNRDGQSDAATNDRPARNAVPPDYPAAALRQGRQGLTVMRFDISEAGLPENIQVVFSVPDSTMFDQESVRAIERWTYDPRIEEGVAVRRTGVETSFRFSVQ